MANNRLLVIDDEKEFVDALALRLEAKGYEILKAYDGADGLDKVHSEKPDLVVLDIMMPGISGFEVCRKIKIDENFKSIPIIVLTAKYQPNDIEFADKLGADAYITKPVEFQALTDKIEELLPK